MFVRCCAVFLLMNSLPFVAGQTSEEGDQEMAVATAAGSGWVPAASYGLFRDADVVAFDLVSDNASTVLVRLQMATLAPDAFPERSDFSQLYAMAFTVLGEGYQLDVVRSRISDPWSGVLSKAVGEQFYAVVKVPAQTDGDAILAAIPRAALAAPDGTVPPKGADLRDVMATARIEQMRGFSCNGEEAVQACGVKARDIFPNSGTAGPFALQSESSALFGSLRIAVPTPVRSSNGQATTHLFEVTLRNEGPAPDIVALNPRDIHDAWNVAVPSSVRLEPGQSRSVTVAISVPFAHQHSVLRSINLTVESSATPSSATLPLGIYWIDPPQPAGHHDTLYVHYDVASTDDQDGLWMDTSAEPSTTGLINLFESIKPQGTAVAVSSYRVGTPLGQGLSIGLDSDLTRQGLLRFELESFVDGAFVFEGRLRFRPNAQEGQAESTVFSIAPLPVAAKRGALAIEAPIQATAAGDLVPVRRPGQLLLDFWLNTTLPAAGSVPNPSPLEADFQLKPEASFLRLPLLEYQDPVPKVASAVSFTLQPTTPVEVRRAPGATALFELRAEGLPQGSIVRSSEGFEVRDAPDKGGRMVAVRFVVPDEAGGFQAFNGYVEAQSPLGEQVIVLLRVISDPSATDNDVDAAAAIFDGDQEASGLSWLAMLAVGALAVARRKKRLA